MILHRSVSAFRISRTKLLSQFRHSFSSIVGDASLCSVSSDPVGFHLLWLKQPRLRHVRAFGTVGEAAGSSGSENDTFFAEERVSWTSLGLSEKVARALTGAGVERPSLVQAACIPSILSGKDVVIAAETGSGKTHGYLVPLIDKLCRANDDSGNTSSGKELTPPRKIFLVLCPNVMLCEQVARMANSLHNDSGDPLLGVAIVGGQQGWPVKKPDIIVSTPAALLNNINPDKQRRLEFLRDVKYVVFDEADMLLCGGFQNQIIRLIDMLRFDEKLLSRTKKSTPERAMDSNDYPLLHVDALAEEDLPTGSISEGEEDSRDEAVIDDLPGKVEAGSVQRKDRRDWSIARKFYERSKQYVFVAATLPVNGKKTAGSVLKLKFPEANWVTGNYLHYHNPRMEQRWVEVSADTQVDALIDAVKQGSRSKMLDCGTDVSRTMVFANTIEAAEEVAAKILSTAGIKCYRYHKGSSFSDREKALKDFQEKGGILVCTDAAARGIDIPNVSHVIQADFATSAVDFLHRIGRTARAGKSGLVTSLYTEANRDLVETVRQAAELGQPVETAFSRKRGFRNKIKKRRNLSNGSSVELSAQA